MRRHTQLAIGCIVLTALLLTVTGPAAGAESGVKINATLYNTSTGEQMATIDLIPNETNTHQQYGWGANYEGTTTTTAGNGDNLTVEGKLIESFEDGDLDEYEGQKSFFSVDQSTSASQHGDYLLTIESDGRAQTIVRTSNYSGGPAPGDEFNVYRKPYNDGFFHRFFFGVNVSSMDSTTGYPSDSYVVQLDTRGSQDSFIVTGPDGSVASQNVELSTTDDAGTVTWYRINVEWMRIGYEVSGRVTDEGGNPIDGATVTFSNESGTVDSVTTDSNGQYSLYLENGTYDATASADGYEDSTATVTVDGSAVTQDFTLQAGESPDLEINTRLFLEHNTSAPYSVVYNDSGQRRDVTDNATVTSANTTIVTVNSNTQTINATSNVHVNGRTYITAEYTTSSGDTLRTTHNVTVANETVDNIDILPTWNRVSASLQDVTLQTIIVATMVGVTAGLFAGGFASISAFAMVMMMGWLAGRVGDGMIMLTILVTAFVGLNVALNIDKSVR